MIFYFHFTHIYLVRATPRPVYLNTNLVYPQELKKATDKDPFQHL